MATLKEISNDIEIMRAEMKMPNFQPPKDIASIMDAINLGSLEKFDPIHLDEMAVKLASYSLYVKQAINRMKAKANFCEANIKKIIGANLRNVSGTFDEKQTYIRSNNKEATELQAIKDETYAKINILDDLDIKIQFLGQTVGNLSRSKKYSRWNKE